MGFPDYVLHKMVTVMKNGEEVKISKRAGSYVTVRDLIEWSAGDAKNENGERDITRGRESEYASNSASIAASYSGPSSGWRQ